MSRGYGLIERAILDKLPCIVKPAILTLPGEPHRSVLAVLAVQLAWFIFGESYTRSQYVSLVRALKKLSSAGWVRLFYTVATNPNKTTRTFLTVEYIKPVTQNPAPGPRPRVDLLAIWKILHPELYK
jgi:hypothetical protein